MLHQLKYKNQESVGAFLGNWFGALLAEQGDLTNIDAIIPVPLHPKKLRQRGYNQVSLFGKELAKHLGATYHDRVLIKTANTKTQSKKRRLGRMEGGKNLFETVDSHELTGTHILLVDDVITTGATIEACASALLKITGVKVYVASMAFVP